MEFLKSKYEMKENTEVNGIELYFEEIPNATERANLKNNGFKWHNIKKCWYIKKEKYEKLKNTTNSIELGTVDIENSYSGNGWKGVNADKHLSITEIAKIIKQELKKKYPDCTFSVTTEGNCHYSGLNISLMKSKTNPFNSYDEAVKEMFDNPHTHIYDENKVSGLTELDKHNAEMAKKQIENTLEKQHTSINQYYIDDDYIINDYAKEMFKYIVQLSNSFNYDDSDSMTDYFDTGFYDHYSIGKWGKSFELVA